MSNLALADFQILKEIQRTRSITAAVEHVGLSQPSISIRLSHLRKYFGDALFVRTSEGMQPTPFLESLWPKINIALDLLSHPDGLLTDFSPGDSDKTFRLGLAHVAQMTLFPVLIALLEKHAPNLKIEAVELSSGTGKLLEAGELDLAIGFATELNTGFYQQRLLTDHYVCIARLDHPRVNKTLTKKQFLSEGYAELVAPATGYALLDKVLEEQGAQRTIKVRVSSLLGMGEIIASTDLLAIVPARLGRTLAAGGRIKALKIPVPVHSYSVRQYWHRRYHREPGNCWLRQFIVDHFRDMPLPRAPRQTP